MLERVWGKRTLLHCWWECKLIQPLRKTVWRFLKKLGIKPPHDPAIPLLGIYPEETKIEKDTCIPMFIAALFTIARTWKQPRCPLTDEWIKKLWYIYTMEYYSAIKGMHLSPFYTSVSLLLSRIQGYNYHLSKFCIYVLVYCIGVFLSGLLHFV